jgi:hypothetical protein
MFAICVIPFGFSSKSFSFGVCAEHGPLELTHASVVCSATAGPGSRVGCR